MNNSNLLNSVSLNLMMISYNTHTVNKYFINIYALLLLLSINQCCATKNFTSEKPVESIDGLYLQDIANILSENLNKTNNEELGVTYIKVSFVCILKLNYIEP